MGRFTDFSLLISVMHSESTRLEIRVTLIGELGNASLDKYRAKVCIT